MAKNGSIDLAELSKNALSSNLCVGLALFGVSVALQRVLFGSRGLIAKEYNRHVTLNVEQGETVCIVGDVHGCLEELEDLLEEVYSQVSDLKEAFL